MHNNLKSLSNMQSSYFEEEQIMIEEKSSHKLKQQYWHKWIQWVEAVRKLRFNAVKMLQYQNQSEERLLTKTFRAWVQLHEQEKFQQLLRLKNSMREHEDSPYLSNHYEKQFSKPNPQPQQQENDDNNLSYKMQLATRFHHRKTYAKCIAGWISYGISCNKFQQNLSKTYIKFLLKKYFEIIHEFKCKSIEKKAKKAFTVMGSPKKQDINQNTHSQMNYVTPTNLINQIDRFPATAQNFRQLLHHNPLMKRNQPPQQPQSNTLYTGFQRNTVGLGQSRRSQFSTLSAQLDYNLKRKFRPITQLPSIPDLENIEKGLGSNDKNTQRNPIKSPIKSYPRYGEQIKSLVSNLSQSNFTQLNQNPQTIKKQKILDLIVKEKLLALAIIKGYEFQEGLEFENYREKTLNGLRKLRDVRIR